MKQTSVEEFYKNISSKECYGCEACVQTCSVHALNMGQDGEGFWIPVHNREKCIECRQCIDVCQIGKEHQQFMSKHKCVQHTYAAYSRDEGNVLKSSSGGVFTELATTTIRKNGVVFGASLEKDFLYHKGVTDIYGLESIRRSKYIQSRIGNSYIETKQYLEGGQWVLFCGTPCQIAGLKLFLGKEYNNLLCADILCHGVPSPSLFKSHIQYLQEDMEEITNYEFRLKKNLKTPYYCCTIQYGNKEKSMMCFQDVYFRLFLDEMTYRERCYNCPYACRERVGDVSLGDFGWAKVFCDRLRKEDRSGLTISTIITNTARGEDILKQVYHRLEIEESSMDDLATRNKAVNTPAKRPDERDDIYIQINQQGYKQWTKQYIASKEYQAYKKIKLKYAFQEIKEKMKKVLIR